jgi:GTP-binding protein
MFLDHATIQVRSGRGGNGIVSFRREKYIPKGGPDGGNGGNGGSIIIRADKQLATLMDFRYRRNYNAPDGERGQGANKTGKSGTDITLRVPVGTIINDPATGKQLADLTADGDEIIVAHGGRGGKGNAEFATSTKQAPRIAQPGTPGEVRTLDLQLKLLADVGLIGFPNAGKSTLISRISAAKPKIADYPFTTLIPNLGIVSFGDYQSFVVADMPGLIEGAHEGKGLGIRFLQHIERTRVLVFLIESVSEDPRNDYETLLSELRSYSKPLAKKPHIIAFTKIDLADKKRMDNLKKIRFGKTTPIFMISAITGTGLQELLNAMWKKLESTRQT